MLVRDAVPRVSIAALLSADIITAWGVSTLKLARGMVGTRA
jgi:hypothetical protein